jgi:hypothetical protein
MHYAVLLSKQIISEKISGVLSALAYEHCYLLLLFVTAWWYTHITEAYRIATLVFWPSI